MKVTKTVEEIKAILDAIGIPRKGLVKRDDLLAALPNAQAYAELCGGARTAIIDKIHAERVLKLRAKPHDDLTMEEVIMLEREAELDEKERKTFDWSIPVKFGKILEPFARSAYESRTGFEVVEVGFVEHDTGGWGVSPDGLIYNADGTPSHGLECKALLPTSHLEYLLGGVLPEEFKFQNHAGMAASGLDRWDLWLHCPGDAPLHIITRRDEFTDQLEAGMIRLVSEKAAMKRKLAALWTAEFQPETGVES